MRGLKQFASDQLYTSQKASHCTVVKGIGLNISGGLCMFIHSVYWVPESCGYLHGAFLLSSRYVLFFYRYNF